MMDDVMSLEERIAIRDSARSLKKYGSTSSYNCTRLDRFIKHQVQKTDTLQGLALKYGVTMEDIRRANRLWANDSIFLREWLLIPSEGGTPGLSPDEPPRPANGEREDSPADFLVRIDCAIASTKSQVISKHGTSIFDAPEDTVQRRRKGSRQRNGSNGEGSSRPAEVMVMTQGRKVRDSLQRLEKETDEIFEL